MPRCGRCWKVIPESAVFCPHCGFSNPLGEAGSGYAPTGKTPLRWLRFLGFILLPIPVLVLMAFLLPAYFRLSETESPPSKFPQEFSSTDTQPISSGGHQHSDLIPVRVVNERVNEFPTKIIQDVAIDKPFTVERVRAALYQQQATLQNRTIGGHSKPRITAVYVWASSEDALAQQGNPLGYLWTYGDGSPPDLTLNESIIADRSNPPEVKLGLSEAMRKQIWKELYAGAVQARLQSEREIPLDYATMKSSDIQTMIKQRERAHELERLSDETICQKYGLPVEAAMEISLEAVKSGWPFQ